MKTASIIFVFLIALCGCMNTAITSGGPIAPKNRGYRDSGGCLHICSNAACWQVEYQLMNVVAALTAIQMDTNRAAYISDKALADYWEWSDKLNGGK
jgi:hypothetical protein